MVFQGSKGQVEPEGKGRRKQRWGLEGTISEKCNKVFLIIPAQITIPYSTGQLSIRGDPGFEVAMHPHPTH